MKNLWTKVTALILTMVMVITVLPMQIFASLIDNSPEYNREMLEAIKGVVGSEDEAELYYELLEHYGLLDDDGNFAESWSIRMDGRDVTLEEILEILEGDYDPDKVVLVDGSPVTLADVRTMVEIEEYVSYIRETYFTDEEWTDEQIESYESLIEQINTRGITFTNDVLNSGITEKSTRVAFNTDANARVTVHKVGNGKFELRLTGAAPEQSCYFRYYVDVMNGYILDNGSKYHGINYGSDFRIKADANGNGTFELDCATGRTYKLDSTNGADKVVCVLNLAATTDNFLFVDENGEEKECMYTTYAMSGGGNFKGPAEREYRLEASTFTDNYHRTFLGWSMELNQYTGATSGEEPIVQALRMIDQGIYNRYYVELTAKTEIQRNSISSSAVPYATSGYAEYKTILDRHEINNQWKGILDNIYDETARIYIPTMQENGKFQLVGNDGIYNVYEKLFRSDPDNAQRLKFFTTIENNSTDGHQYVPEKKYLAFASAGGTVRYGENGHSSWDLTKAAIVLYDGTKPQLEGWRAGVWSDYMVCEYGSGIPIVCVFTEPVLASETSIVVNGMTIRAEQEGGNGTRQVFIYPVQKSDISNLVISGYKTMDLAGNVMNTSSMGNFTPITFSEYDIVSSRKYEFIDDVHVTAGFDKDYSCYYLDVTADISDDPEATAWMTQEDGHFDENNEFRDLYFTVNIVGDYDAETANGHTYNGMSGSVLSTLVEGPVYQVTGGKLKGTLHLNLGDYFSHDEAQPLECVVCLWLVEKRDENGEDEEIKRLIKLTESAVLNPLKLVRLEDLGVRITVEYSDPDLQDFDRTFLYKDGIEPGGTLYRIPVNLGGDPVIRARVVLDGEDFTFGDTEYCSVLVTDEYGSHFEDQRAHFIWGSDKLNCDITPGIIDEKGYITPFGVNGYLRLKLAPLNGFMSNTVRFWMPPLYFDFLEGYRPYMVIPNSGKTREITPLVPFTFYWNSNLAQKADGQDVNIHIALGVRDPSDPDEFLTDNLGGVERPLLIYEADETFNRDNIVTNHTIPVDYLQYIYYNESYNHLLLKITSSFDGVEYSSSMKIDVTSPPARVNFEYRDDSHDLYIADTAGSVKIPWTIRNFGNYTSGGDLFELEITKSKNRSASIIVSDPGTGDGQGTYTGSYTLDISDVVSETSDPTSYKEVYVVTIRAKNGNDSTWSYDSFMLYVYDADALAIMVDGEKTDEFTMSNRKEFSALTSEQILAYEREIALSNKVSVNYTDFSWAELTDRMAWRSSDNSVATLNYKQGLMYDDIRNYTFDYYRPTTELMLSGLSDGSTVITATHSKTGISAGLDVTVETMKDRLYLFQFYPKATTEVTYYVNGSDDPITVSSDSSGALAVYEETGIRGLISCSSTAAGVGGDEKVFLGSFKAEDLVSGEKDSAMLELYPVNYLELRQAAYAYVYLKTPGGSPYSGDVIFRGGVYINGEYLPGAMFSLNNVAAPSLRGDEDQVVHIGEYGKLEVLMDQTQWTGDATLTPTDEISYAFMIKAAKTVDGTVVEDTAGYPLLVEMDARVNSLAYISSGDAIVTFRRNEAYEAGVGYVKHPFLLLQYTVANGIKQNVLHTNKRVGINDTTRSCTLTSIAMWWGEDATADAANSLQIFSMDGERFAYRQGEYANRNAKSAYPFLEEELTEYTITISEDSLGSVVPDLSITGAYIEFYRDGMSLSHKEEMSIQICNLTGAGKVNESDNVASELEGYGSVAGTSGKNTMQTEDGFVNRILNLVSESGNFTDGEEHLFEVRIASTADPTRFLGFIQANYGDRIEDDDEAGITMLDPGNIEFEEELALGDRYEMATTPASKWASDRKKEINSAKNNEGGDFDLGFALGGYMEVLIYYSFPEHEWKMQPLYGGFHVNGSIEYGQVWNEWIGYIPVTMELTAGGTVEISMDAITTSYLRDEEHMGNVDFGTEFLTQLRIYLYLKLFAGVGVDYSVFAVKLGIFGMISLDMQFVWLNRPYLKEHPNALLMATGEDENGVPNEAEVNTEKANLSGQHLRINGQIGIELVIRALFYELDWTLFSVSFDFLNRSFNDYDNIQKHWENNQKNMQRAIEALLDNGDVSVVGGNRGMVAVSMAPTVESRDYLGNGESEWGYTPRRGPASVINNLESNTYPYADPEITRDGELVVYLTDQNSEDISMTRAAFATSGWPTYSQGGLIDDGGYGDNQLAVDGNGNFAVAAWSRQMYNLKLEAGAVISSDEQRMMLDGTDIMASVYANGKWTTTQLTSDNTADIAPTVAVSGNRAVVAWRSVIPGENPEDVMQFINRDVILYKVYDHGEWGETKTLYNGTNGTVKAITSVMMSDGTAAVAYTIDTNYFDDTINDREIVYAVIGTDGEVTRNVRCTNDDKLDENPQITVVTFPQDGEEHFLLGWYTQASASATGSGGKGSDICLLDFDEEGITGQLIPESMSKVATSPDVTVTSDFRFSKNASDLTDLSMIWVERENSLTDDQSSGGGNTSEISYDLSGQGVEKDVIKGIKFYLYGPENNLIGLTDALKIAEMPDATLINHFDAYTLDGYNVKAVVLGTTYGKDGILDEKSSQTTNGIIVDYTVPRATYAMYTAQDTYSNDYEIQAIAVDYDSIRLGSDIKVGFSVRNRGTEPITRVEAVIGGKTTVFTGFELLPGYTKEFWADYTVPSNDVVDPDYSISVSFSSWTGNVIETPEAEIGTVMMDLPDLQVIGSDIIEEVGGKRTIQIKLNNRQDSVLEGSGRKVKISFWRDPTYETPVGYDPDTGIGLADIVISDSRDLRLIDEGGYSTQVEFDVGAYLKGNGTETVEIAEGGFPVYIRADVLQTVEGNDLIVPEPVVSNNYSHITCDNLKLRTGLEVLANSDINVDNGVTTVTIHLQNTTMAPNENRNLIVYLLDEDGRIIAQKQTYDTEAENNGLITLGAEEKKDVVFTFDTTCRSMRYAFTDLTAGENNAELSSVTISGISGVTLQDLASGTASVTVDDLNSIRIDATACSPFSLITVTAQTGEETETMRDTSVYTYTAKGVLNMYPGKVSVLRIHVQNPMAEDGNTEKDYTLTINNFGDPEIGRPTFNLYMDPETQETTATITVSAVQQPPTADYTISYKWYQCDVNGGNLRQIERCEGDETPEVTVRDDFRNDPKFYICGIRRTYLDGTVSAPMYSEICAVLFGRFVVVRTKDLVITYGDVDPVNAYNTSITRLYELDDMGDEYAGGVVRDRLLEYSLSFSRDKADTEEGRNVGTYAVTPALSQNYLEYNGETFFVLALPGTLTILPKEATVRADNLSKVIGEEDPEFTVTYSGIDFHDWDPDVREKPKEGLIDYDTVTREPGEELGDYTIFMSGEEYQGNYHLTFVNGTLSIIEDHVHDGIEFSPWLETDSLPETGGNWYLVHDVTLSRAWYCAVDTNICLNGHTITGTEPSDSSWFYNSIIEICDGARVGIYDETGSGAITGHKTVQPQLCRIITVSGNSTLDLYGGSITAESGEMAPETSVISIRDSVFNMYGGSVGRATHENSCAVEVGHDQEYNGDVKAYGTFNMYGGVIENNVTETDVGGWASGVIVATGCAFNMSGGEIRNNSVHLESSDSTRYGIGAGVCNDGTFVMTGGRITGNTLTSTGASVCGAGVCNNAGTFTISGGEITGNTASDGSGAKVFGGGVFNGGTMTISGGLIKDNAGGDICQYIGGEHPAPIVINGMLSEGCTVVTAGDDSSYDLEYSAGVFTSGLSGKGPAGSFRSYNDDYAVVTTEGGEARLVESSSVDVYTIVFRDENGRILETLKVAEGEIPVYSGEFMVKPASGGATYEQTGWDPQITAAAADQTYTAAYSFISTAPVFKSHSLLLSGEIGVVFYVDLSMLTPEQREGVWAEFTVGGKQTVVYFNENFTNPQTHEYYGFTCYVTAAEMADSISAILHYGEGGTVSDFFSVAEYVNYVNDHPGSFTQTGLTDLTEAIADYGHYVQAALAKTHGWTTGLEHAEMDNKNEYTEADVTAARTAVKNYAFERSNDGEHISSFTYTLNMESEIGIRMYMNVDNGFTGVISATVDGNPVECLMQNRTCRVEIPNIPPHELGRTYEVKIFADGQPEFTVHVSALSYIKAVLDLKGSGNTVFDTPEMQYAVTSVYRYYAAARAYSDSNSN